MFVKCHTSRQANQTHQSLQQLELQRGHRATELGGVGTGLLAALQQLKQGGIHVVRLRRSGAKAFEVQDGGTQEGDLRGQIVWK